MNDKVSEANNTGQSRKLEQIARHEICEHCHGELDKLSNEIDRSTLTLENQSHRLKFLLIFSENSGLEPPDQAAEVLHRYEINRQNSDASFDITKLPRTKLNRIIERNRRREQKLEETTATEKSEQEYRHRVEQLKSSGKSNTEIIQLLANDPATAKSEKARFQDFSQIIILATLPEDLQRISGKINSLNLAKLPDPIAFIQHQIFDSPDQPSGFSDSYQASVADAYNLPQIRSATVADMTNSLDQKIPIIDPNNGKVTGYKPAITRDNASKVRPGIIIYVDENGQKTYEDLASGQTFPFQGGASGNLVDRRKLQFLNSRSGLLDKGIENMFGLNLKNAQIPKNHELEKIHAIQNALLGGTQNLDPEVMYDQQQESFARRFLFLSQFGETVPFTHSAEQIALSWGQLGITKSADPLDVNINVLQTVGEWMNEHPNISGRTAFEELKIYLKAVSV